MKGIDTDLAAPSALSCRKAALALSVVCLLKVATLTYPSLPFALAELTVLLTGPHICDVTGLIAMRCLVSVYVRGPEPEDDTSSVTCWQAFAFFAGLDVERLSISPGLADQCKYVLTHIGAETEANVCPQRVLVCDAQQHCSAHFAQAACGSRTKLDCIVALYLAAWPHGSMAADLDKHVGVHQP